MKKIIIAAAIVLSCLTLKNAEAQIHFSIGLNIGSQPDWGPVGYDRAAYYYIPDIDAYYDVNAHQYVYLENNAWVHRASLPARWAHYDLYSGYKVVLNEPSPWMHASVYRTRYASYRGRHDQSIIVNSHDNRYRNHWHDAQAARAHQLNARNNHLDNRAHNLNQRDQHLDNRAKNLNQRDKHLDQRAKQLNAKQQHLNQREKKDDHKGHH